MGLVFPVWPPRSVHSIAMETHPLPTAPGVSPAPTGTTAIAGTATIRVEPSSARLDEPFRVTASGLPPGRPVTIRASTRDGELRGWGSHATFVVEPEGALDLGPDQPQAGHYER